ncbi:MAG: GNAT family N-acetyltransferase [Kofleriaceae bacterium]
MEKSFSELLVPELYRILAVRQQVFVVEQACPYLDADGLDVHAQHLWREQDGQIAAYLRILPAGTAYDQPSIGRVITAPSARRTGLGRELMTEGMARAWARHGRVGLVVSAQAYLERFYGELGFRRASDNYLEDGIPHLKMIAEPLSPL